MAHKLNLNISNMSVKITKLNTLVGLIFYYNLNWKPYLHELSKISRGIGVHITSIILFTYLPLPHLRFINLGQILIVLLSDL